MEVRPPNHIVAPWRFSLTESQAKLYYIDRYQTGWTWHYGVMGMDRCYAFPSVGSTPSGASASIQNVPFAVVFCLTEMSCHIWSHVVSCGFRLLRSIWFLGSAICEILSCMKTGHSGVTEIASTVFREQVRFLLCSYPRTSHFCVVNRTLFDGVHDLRQHQASAIAHALWGMSKYISDCGSWGCSWSDNQTVSLLIIGTPPCTACYQHLWDTYKPNGWLLYMSGSRDRTNKRTARLKRHEKYDSTDVRDKYKVSDIEYLYAHSLHLMRWSHKMAYNLGYR